MTGTAQQETVPFVHREEFSISIIRAFFTIILSALTIMIAVGVEHAGQAVSAELSRYEPVTDAKDPTERIPFIENGPNIAIAEGVRR